MNLGRIRQVKGEGIEDEHFRTSYTAVLPHTHSSHLVLIITCR